jgi:hypothetical protein
VHRRQNERQPFEARAICSGIQDEVLVAVNAALVHLLLITANCSEFFLLYSTSQLHQVSPAQLPFATQILSGIQSLLNSPNNSDAAQQVAYDIYK